MERGASDWIRPQKVEAKAVIEFPGCRERDDGSFASEDRTADAVGGRDR